MPVCVDQEFVLLRQFEDSVTKAYSMHFLDISLLETILTAISVRVSILTVWPCKPLSL